MVSKTKSTKPLEPPLAEATSTARAVERCVCYRTVTCDFTLEDVTKWLFPPEVFNMLHTAHSYARPSFLTTYTDTILLPNNTPVKVYLDCEAIGLIPPKLGLCKLQDTETGSRIIEALYNLEQIITQWKQVYKVINWLNNNATLSAAKFYMPALGALLPQEHPFHRARGHIAHHACPKRPISEIAPDIRSAMTILASGLLIYDPALKCNSNHFSVSMWPRDEDFDSELEAVASQSFSLL
mgnify:FL=1